MPRIRDLEYRLNEVVFLIDGAMGTYLHARGLPVGHCREAVNLEKPSMVLSIHQAYLHAGADILETNTFAANAVQLARYGLEKKVREINLTGARLARETAEHRPGVLVAGSVGPLGLGIRPYGPLSETEAMDLYAEQILALAEGGVDLLFIETQHSVEEACLAIRTARKYTDLFVVALLTVNPQGRTPTGQRIVNALPQLVQAGAGAVGINCTIGPNDMFELTEACLRVVDVPFAVMPNAGYPDLRGDQAIYTATPEYFAEFVPLFLERGVRLLGSCCGTTPEHTRALAGVLRKERIPRRTRSMVRVSDSPSFSALSEGVVERPALPENIRVWLGTNRVLTVEIEAPATPDPSRVLDLIKHLRARGVHAVHVVENPLIRGHMSPLALAGLIRQQTGCEVILHVFSRSREPAQLQSEILGAAAMGVRGVLAMSGGVVPLGAVPEPRSAGLDVLGLIRMMVSFNEGRLIGGDTLTPPTRFIIGSVINPYPPSEIEERERIREKIENGVKFLVTPPVFEIETLRRIREEWNLTEVDILVGILPVMSLRHLRYLHYEVPGIFIPQSVLERFKTVKKETFSDAAIELCEEVIAGVWEEVSGFYLIPPGRRFEPVFKLLERLQRRMAKQGSHPDVTRT